jgi:hypothetical protein
MVHHLKRGKTQREPLPRPSLVSAVSQGSLPADTSGARKARGQAYGGHGALGHLPDPRGKDGGAAESGGGKESTPPVACHVRLPCGTREAPRRMRREVDRRKGEPLDAMPMPARRGGWGGVVSGRASRLPGEVSPRRRPRAGAKRGTKVPSARGSGTRGDTRGTGALGTDASWYGHGTQAQVLSRRRCKPSVRFSTGGVRKRTGMQRALRLPNCLAPAVCRV